MCRIWLTMLTIPGFLISFATCFRLPIPEQDARNFLDKPAHWRTSLRDLAITHSDELIGVMGYSQMRIYRHWCRIRLPVAEPFWEGDCNRCGPGLCPWVFERTLVRLTLRPCLCNNPASIRVLEKAGFQQEGIARKGVIKHDQILDEIHFARIRSI